MRISTLIILFVVFTTNAFAQQKLEEKEISNLMEEAKVLKQSNFMKSDSVLNIALIKAKGIKNNQLTADILIERILCQLNLEDLEKAKALNHELNTINKLLKNKETLIKEKYFNGLIAMKVNELLVAIKNFSEVKNHHETNKNWKEFVKSSNHLAWCYYLNQQEEIGKKVLAKALERAIEIQYEGIGDIYERLGVMYANKNSTMDSALLFFKKAETYFINEKNFIKQAYLNNNIGALFFYKNEYEKAITYLNKALEGFKEAGLDNELYFIYSSLGVSHLNNKDLKNGEYYLLKAYDMVKKDSMPSTDELLIKEDEDIYFNLARLYEEKKDFRLAYQFLRIERKIKNAKNRVDYQNEIMAITKSNEMFKKENEITVLKVKQEQDKLKQFKWIFSLILLVIILAVVIIFIHTKQKRNQVQLALNAKAEERHRISRDLHDNIGSYAATILNNVENLNFETKGQINQQLLTEINANAKSMLSSIRDTLVVLNNKPIDFKSILSKFDIYCKEILQSYPNIDLKIDDNSQNNIILDAVDGVNLQYILKEFFNNAIKHSKANYLNLLIHENDASLNIEFNDNGIGFDRENITAKNGLENIHYRAEQLKAVVNLEAQVNKGTKWNIIFNKNKLKK